MVSSNVVPGLIFIAIMVIGYFYMESKIKKNEEKKKNERVNKINK